MEKHRCQKQTHWPCICREAEEEKALEQIFERAKENGSRVVIHVYPATVIMWYKDADKGLMQSSGTSIGDAAANLLRVG